VVVDEGGRFRAWYVPEVFDGQGKRSIESADFPPQRSIVCARGGKVSQEGGNQESMNLGGPLDGAGRTSMQKVRTMV